MPWLSPHLCTKLNKTLCPKTPVTSLNFLKDHVLVCFFCLLEVNLRGDTVFNKYCRVQHRAFRGVLGRRAEIPCALCDVPCQSSFSAEPRHVMTDPYDSLCLHHCQVGTCAGLGASVPCRRLVLTSRLLAIQNLVLSASPQLLCS